MCQAAPAPLTEQVLMARRCPSLLGPSEMSSFALLRYGDMGSGQALASERSLETHGRQAWWGTWTTSSLLRVQARRVPPEAGAL